MNKKTIEKLKLAFWNGYAVPEACVYAGVTQEDYEKAVASSTVFERRMNKAQLYPTVKAKVELARAIRGGNVRLAMKYLEAREPERYNLAYIARFGKAADEW